VVSFVIVWLPVSAAVADLMKFAALVKIPLRRSLEEPSSVDEQPGDELRLCGDQEQANYDANDNTNGGSRGNTRGLPRVLPILVGRGPDASRMAWAFAVRQFRARAIAER
jgi:hypothetical protein